MGSKVPPRDPIFSPLKSKAVNSHSCFPLLRQCREDVLYVRPAHGGGHSAYY